MNFFHQTTFRHFAVTCVLVLTFLVYIPNLFNDFVNMDDPGRITDNPLIRSLSPDNIARIFNTIVNNNYTPLTILSFAMEYAVAGMKPFLYHLDNVLLHLLNVFLVYRLGLALGLSEIASSAACFVFAFHPMHVESVAWISERKGLLYSVFYLGSVLMYLRFLKTASGKDFGISVGLGVLSILSKPMAVSLPLILLLCDWFVKGTIEKKDWLTKIPFGLLIFAVGAVTFHQNSALVTQNLGVNPLFRFWAAAFYLKKFFWPVICIPHYVPPVPADLSMFEYWLSLAILAIAIMIFIRLKNKWLRFGLLWMYLSVFFLLNFDYPRFMQTVADRYMYLPSAGVCLFLGHGVERFWFDRSLKPGLMKLGRWVIIGTGLFLAVKTFLQIGIWHDSFRLWDYTARHTPGSFWAHNYRGKMYELQGRYDLALADYEECVRLNPNYARVYVNLAVFYEQEGNENAAFENYSRAIALNPGTTVALNNRALIFERRKDFKSALADLNQAVAADPGYILGLSNRGALFLQTHKYEAAIRDFTAIVELQPEHLEAYINRSLSFLGINSLDEALQDCQTAIRLKPSNGRGHFVCSQIYAKMGLYDRALREAKLSGDLNYPVDKAYFETISRPKEQK